MKKLIAAIALILGLASCTQKEIPDDYAQVLETVKVWGKDVGEDNLDLGHMNVHVTEGYAAELEAATGEDGYVRVEETRASASGILRMKRLFPYAGEFEPRTRESGLHLWYVVEYDSSTSITKAASGIVSAGEVDEIEYPVKIRPVEVSDKPVYVELSSPRTASGPTALFNDPRLKSQWNYYNEATASTSAAGCDINVTPVWKTYTTGSSDVIVGVVDQGVDYKHEDLSANMWINKEQTGDLRYGKNFVKDNYYITAGDHGTHVAGTIAAVNNNGKGVCGIAGGNAAQKQSGVKIMSCQIFDGNKTASGAAAIKWSCDHGAVISQNSWGSTVAGEIESSLASAVAYFVKYAGVDASGNQTGPIKGGLVVFAAGNDNSSKPYGTYDPAGNIINVASVGADYRRAYYSNYGDWVNIAAPGGDVTKGNQILSTFTGNRYGYYQGTSMACPHVSGVLALLVSKMKGSGVKASEIRSKLLGGTTDISSFNPNYKLGAGLVNCYKAMAGSGGKAPSVPTGLKLSAFSNNVTVSAVIPKDSDDGKPNAIAFYYSKSAITSTKGLEFSSFYVGDLEPGDTLRGVVTGLDFNTCYYFAAQAIDLADNRSALSSNVTVTTGSNFPPVISPRDTAFSFKAHQNPSILLSVSNPAGHHFAVDLFASSKDSLALSLDTTVRERLVLGFEGAKLDEGEHVAKVKVEDNYGCGDSSVIRFTILPNHKPYVLKQLDNRIFSSKYDDAVRYSASDYFKDDDGEQLKYQVDIEGGSVNCIYEKGNFVLTPMDYGYSTIKITASDVRGEKASQSFKVLVRNSSAGSFDLYPNPVSSNLYFRTSDKTPTSIVVRIVSSSGVLFTDRSLQVSAFAPACVDMSSAAPGMYSVSVTYAGVTVIRQIMKI